MSLETLDDLFHDQLKDLYSAERQLLTALPRMAKAASAQALQQAFEKHLAETEEQVSRLDQIGKQLGITLKGKKCKAMEGLIEEGKEILEEEGSEAVIDAGLIAAAQRVEHYEISGYGSARALADQLGHRDAVELLQTTLDEEAATDETLTELSEKILPMAQNGEAAESETSDKRSNTGRGARHKAARV